MPLYKPSDHELEAFYCSLGKVICEFHKFEYLVSIILCVVKNEEFPDLQQAWSALDKDQKKALGKLIKELRKNVYFVETFQFQLTEIVHERNWIVHKLPGAMRLYMEEQYQFKRLSSRLTSTSESCSDLTKMLERWFFGNVEFQLRIGSLPPEIIENFDALKNV